MFDLHVWLCLFCNWSGVSEGYFFLSALEVCGYISEALDAGVGLSAECQGVR